MRLLFDCTSAQPVKLAKVNGGGAYSITILKELLKLTHLQGVELHISLDKKRGDISKRLNDICSESSTFIFYENNNDFSKIINNGGYDKVFFPILYPSYYDLHINDDIEVIGGIHDLSTLYQGVYNIQPGRFYKRDGLNLFRFFYFTFFKNIITRRAYEQHSKLLKLNAKTRIYTVSNYTRAAICDFFDMTNESIDVYYSPLEEMFFKSVSKSQYNFDFFLMSSGSRYLKNNYRAIKALDSLFTKKKINCSYKVIVTGCDKEHCSFYLRSVRNKSNFIFRDFVSRDELNCLYANAMLFIYPSLLEGFGYPPIEAMKQGTISICSSFTSIPEVCGDAVIYFNPLDVNSIAIAILQALDTDYSKEIKTHIKARLHNIEEKQKKDTADLLQILLK